MLIFSEFKNKTTLCVTRNGFGAIGILISFDENFLLFEPTKQEYTVEQLEKIKSITHIRCVNLKTPAILPVADISMMLDLTQTIQKINET